MALFDRFRKRPTLHAVIPIVVGTGKERQDLQRAGILFQSLRAGFDRRQCLHVHVVGRKAELPALQADLAVHAAPWLKLSFHDELELVPELQGSHAIGWIKQQIIKMAAAEWLDADYWLTFDADVVCVRNFGIEDLFVDGRAIARLIPTAGAPLFAAWVRASGEDLGYGQVPDERILDMTPALYSREVMRRVQRAVRAASGKPWRQALLQSPTLRYRIGTDFAGWAEMALYALVAQREGLLQQYHAICGIDTDRRLMADGSIWTAASWQDWSPPDMRDPAKPGYFIVCGSHTGVPVEVVAERIKPVVELLEQRLLVRPVEPPPPAPLPVAAPPPAAPGLPLEKITLRVTVSSARPMIVMGALDEWDQCFIAPAVLQRFASIPAYFLITLPWTQDDMASAAPLAQMLAQRRRDFPNHSFFVLCNSRQEASNFRQLGVPSGLFNHNIFVDQNVFRPLPDQAKRFDAVYNAALVDWKRHHLAREIPRLELLFAPWHQNLGTADYVGSLRRDLPQASFVNQPAAQDQYRFLTPEEVVRQLNQAQVGLCLSAVEGAMYSSMEYLLCGLPVVSTPSLGGRDLFFNADHAMIVEPQPRAVAQGVAEMIARRLAPQDVREAALAQVVEYRQKFLRLIEEIYVHEQATWPPRQPLPDPFVGRGLTPMNVFQLEKLLFSIGGV
jgi:glycosyltransferase involved in cell wall biosynthesis